MLSSDWSGLLMALVAILAPLWLAWLLLAWGERKRKRGPDSGSKGHHLR
jgi:hypothetical protein